jgi:integrase
MSKVWIEDLWIKNPERKLADGTCIKAQLPSAMKKQLSKAKNPHNVKIPEEFKSAKFGVKSRYQVVLIDTINGKRVRKSKRFGTLELAQEYRDEIARAIKEKTYVSADKSRTLFKHIIEEWINSKTNIKCSTVFLYKTLLRAHILPKFGDIEIAKITECDIALWISEVKASGLKIRYVRSLLFTMNQIMKYASSPKHKYIFQNPAEDIKLPKEAKRHYMAILDNNQVKRLAAVAKDMYGDGVECLILVMAYTGVRVGEALAIKKEDIDFAERRIQISKGWTRDENGKPVLSTTKTNKTRYVPIPNFLMPTIEHIAKTCAKDEFLFKTKKGKVLTKGHFSQTMWKKLIIVAELNNIKGLTVHSLRHTCASLAIRAGADVKTLQTMLGHSSAAMTLDIYASFFPNRLHEIADLMDADWDG